MSRRKIMVEVTTKRKDGSKDTITIEKGHRRVESPVIQLKRIRNQKGISVAKLAKLSGVPVRTIEDIERFGEGKISTAKKLAVALEMTLDELCAIENETEEITKLKS
jgi:DNA-binding XRE family transcriptional regulator